MKTSGLNRTKVNFHLLGLCLLALISFNTASAKVILSPLFSDHMVLQQKNKVAIWGKSTANKALQSMGHEALTG